MAIAPFHGLARKLVLPLIALSGVGWLLYVIGFGIFFQPTPAAGPESFTFYAAAVVGPFVYISAVVHAALWRQISSIVGSITAVLSMLYFTAMGAMLHNFGSVIYQHYNSDPSPIPLTSSMELMFAGSFLACFFWAGVLAMWPWYTTGAPTRGQPQSSMSEPLDE